MAVIRCPKCGRAADGMMCLACGHEWSSAAAPAPVIATAPPSSPSPVGAAAPAPISIPSGSADAPVAVAPASTAAPANPFATPATAAFQEPSQPPAPPVPVAAPTSAPDFGPSPLSSVANSVTVAGPSASPKPLSAPLAENPAVVDNAKTIPMIENPSTPSAPVPTPQPPSVSPPTGISTNSTSSPAPMPPVATVSPTIATCDECGQVMPNGQTTCLVCGWSPQAGAGARVNHDDPFSDVLANKTDFDAVTVGGAAPPKNAFSVPVLPKGPQGAVANQSGFFSTSPMFFVAAGATGFFGVLALGGILMLALSSGNEVDVVAAQQTVRVLSQKPDRSALDYITLGHAHADTNDVGKALSAYRFAATKGSVDKRSVRYSFEHLKDPLQGKSAGLLLAEVFQEDVTERLIDGVENDNLNHRRNALLALQTRHEATDGLREKVARQDLVSDATCDMRKEALLVLEKIGSTAEAAIAIETAIGRGAVENSCMSANLPVVLRVVRERNGS